MVYEKNYPTQKQIIGLMCLEFENKKEIDMFLIISNSKMIKIGLIWQLIFRSKFLEERIVNIPSNA